MPTKKSREDHAGRHRHTSGNNGKGTGVFVAGKELNRSQVKDYARSLIDTAIRRAENGHTYEKNATTREQVDEAQRYLEMDLLPQSFAGKIAEAKVTKRKMG